MTENPKHYSDEEWQEIFDGETVSEEQIEQEWRHFEDKYMKPQPIRLWRIAAMFVGVMMLSGIALAAVHIIRNTQTDVGGNLQSPTQETRMVNTQQPSEEDINVLPHTVVFENTELQQIVDSLSIYYKVKPAYRHDSVRHLRLYYEWNQSNSISEIASEISHFDHVSISLKGDSIIIE